MFKWFHHHNFQIWFALVVNLLLPTLYTTFRMRLLNLSLDPQQLGLISQLQWLPLVFEVFSDALLPLLAFHFGSVIEQQNRLGWRIGNALSVVFVSYVFLALVIGLSGEYWLAAMAYQGWEPKLAYHYLVIETLALIPMALILVLKAVLIAVGQIRWLYGVTVIHLAVSVSSDVVFIPLAHQQHMLYAAISPLLSSTFMLILMLLLLKHLNLWPSSWINTDGLSKWLQQSGLGVVECLLRNAVFGLMILRLINHTGQSALFWITNTFIWGWLLLPIMALGQVVRRQVANHGVLSVKQLGIYLVFSTAIVVIWLLSVPLWEGFIAQTLGYEHAEQASSLAYSQLWFYWAFALGYPIQQYFVGLGYMGWILVQTMVVNLGYYGMAYWGWRWGMWTTSLDNIVLLFGYGMVFSLILWLMLYGQHQRLVKSNVITP